jgi:hypothetical protein
MWELVMKCEVCLNLVEEYIDGELVEHDAEQVSAHLIACARCANEVDTLSAEQEVYARYDRALDISPSLWHDVEAVIAQEHRVIDSGSRLSLREWFVLPSFGLAFAGAMAVLIVAVVIGVVYLRTHRQVGAIAEVNNVTPIPSENNGGPVKEPPRKSDGTTVGPGPNQVERSVKATPKSSLPPTEKPGRANQSDVLFSDVAYSDIEDQDTQRHIEQAQNLFRSIRNIKVSDDDAEIDVSYEKALSRRLLNENIVLRRDAEMSGKFPAKTLLSNLEPFLIDIANLEDKTTSNDLRVIKERVQKTEIVAALQGY